MRFNITTLSEAETLDLGRKLSQQLSSGDVVAFYGDLGSGKTCCIRGICDGLNVHEDVTSPTFTLINEYSNSLPVYHFDFYRIYSDEEVYGLGYEEYFYGAGVCLIEWAERIANFLPENRIDIHINSVFESTKQNIRYFDIQVLGEYLQQKNWDFFVSNLNV